MASSDNEYYDCGEDDDDQSYQSASDYSDDDVGGVSSDGDDYTVEEEEEEGEEEGEQLEETDDDDTDALASAAREKRYGVLTVDAVRALQDECTAKVADLILLPPAFAAAVLRHCRWSAVVAEDRWFSDEQRVRDAVGLPASGAPVARNDAPLVCAVCFEVYSPGEMRSAGCEHFYCLECWRGYVRSAVGDGPRCLSLRCPDPSCPVAVVRDLVDEVAGDEEKARYTEFVVRSYVEESKKIRWCPAPGCTLAVEYLDGEQCKEQVDVVCACKHVFCLGCGEEAHRPVPCDTVREWLVKHSSDSETANWVLANTKHCPECRRPIEKNMGCMHMTCSDPCRHEFCWLCLGPWSEHRGGEYYNCNRYAADKSRGKLTEEETRRQLAKASIDRYLHYYERWAAHERSRQKALEDIEELEAGGGLEALAAAVAVVETQLDFLTVAYRQIVECRRMLRWTYAYGYYLAGDDEKDKCGLFEHLQSDAEASLERLHGCAEKDRMDLVDADDAAAKYGPYRERLASLTLVTRNHFENLVRALETGLAEVKVKPAPASDESDDPADPVAHLHFIFPEEPEE